MRQEFEASHFCCTRFANSVFRGFYGATVLVMLVLSAGCRDKSASGESIGSAPAMASSEDLDSEFQLEASGQTPRLVVLGTSLTAGLGLDPDSAWPAVVQRLADSSGVALRVDNAGLSGETSAGALSRVRWVLSSPADIVVLEVGANDGLRGMDPSALEKNLVEIIAVVKELHPEAAIGLVRMEAPPNLGAQYVESFRGAYERAASVGGIELLPFILDGVAGLPEYNQDDGIHPNVAGAEIIGRRMWQAILPMVEASSRAEH